MCMGPASVERNSHWWGQSSINHIRSIAWKLVCAVLYCILLLLISFVISSFLMFPSSSVEHFMPEAYNAFLPGPVCFPHRAITSYFTEKFLTGHRVSCLLIVLWWYFADQSEFTLLLTCPKTQPWMGSPVAVFTYAWSSKLCKRLDLFPGV